MKIKNTAVKAEKQSLGTESGNDMPVKEMDILDHIEKIVKISRKWGIDKCLSGEKGKKHFDYVSEKLGISPLQAVLFSHFLEKDGTDWSGSELSKSLKCSRIRIKKYLYGFEGEELEKKKIIRFGRENGKISSYSIPPDLINSLRKFNEYKPEKTDNLTIFKFFSAAGKLYNIRKDKEYSYDILKSEIFALINQNMHLAFCHEIISEDLGKDSVILLILFCLLFWKNSDDHIIPGDFEFLYEEEDDFMEIKFELSEGDEQLMRRKYIEYANNNGFADKEAWRLTYTTKKELLSELKFNLNYKRDIVLSENIAPKKMYYNRKEGEAIEKLTSLLQEENYQKIVSRLDGKNMRKGFACLFSGGPGTGKTETVYQIARETKRDIFLVDISATKSMWFGESEKIIKKIFDAYRSAVEKSEIAPILLFNEADAVIGRRREYGSSGSAVDQTENTIQNIILQEMENLSGILIATTNLTQNMDSAFERRFLYKITFDKPSMESRKGIWNALLPDLPESNAAELSGKFELSGGQIENIARKVEVDAIINGSELCMEKLAQYCKDESQNGFNTSKRIGFGNE